MPTVAPLWREESPGGYETPGPQLLPTVGLWDVSPRSKMTTWIKWLFCSLSIIGKARCKSNKQDCLETTEPVCKVTFAAIWAELFLPVACKTCIYDYLHCRDGKAKVPCHPPYCPHLDSLFLNSHYKVTRKRRQVISLRGSHLSHCSTSVSAISIDKLTGGPLVLFLRQKSQLESSSSSPPRLVPIGSRRHYWVPWWWRKRNLDFCTPCSWNTRGSCLSRMPLLLKI